MRFRCSTSSERRHRTEPEPIKSRPGGCVGVGAHLGLLLDAAVRSHIAAGSCPDTPGQRASMVPYQEVRSTSRQLSVWGSRIAARWRSAARRLLWPQRRDDTAAAQPATSAARRPGPGLFPPVTATPSQINWFKNWFSFLCFYFIIHLHRCEWLPLKLAWKHIFKT